MNIKSHLEENNIEALKTESGLYYTIEKEGEGPSPQAGDYVKVHYDGYFLDGKKFDSSVDRGEAFVFPLGKSRVIQGWDLGIPLLKVGGKERCTYLMNWAMARRELARVQFRLFLP